MFDNFLRSSRSSSCEQLTDLLEIEIRKYLTIGCFTLLYNLYGSGGMMFVSLPLLIQTNGAPLKRGLQPCGLVLPILLWLVGF